VLSIALGASLAPLDSAVNAAFPTITGHFARPVADIRWVIIVYVLTYAALLLGFGRLADLAGHRRVFVAGLAWCAVALSLCALAQRFEVLLAARIAQGVGTALVLASAPALVTLTLPPRQRTRGIAVYTLGFALAATLGPLAGGVLVQHFGWPVVFWMRVPLALAAILLTLWRVPATRPPASEEQRFDAVSGLTLAVGLAAALLALGQGGHFGWRSPTTLALAGAGTTLLLFFARRQRDPLRRVIDLGLFRNTPFAVVNVSHVLLNAAYFMVMLLVPYYLQRAHGDAGVTLLALSPLGFALGSPLAERALRHHAAATVSLAALALSALALAAVALWPERAPVAWIAVVLLGTGLGYGLFQVAAMDQVMGGLPRAQQGVAGSLNMLTRTVGVVLGASAGAAAFDTLEAREGFLAAFAAVFHGAWLLTGLTLALVLAARARAARPPAAP
jgi:EmrB/QacA subfamily drug resistance transporter